MASVDKRRGWGAIPISESCLVPFTPSTGAALAQYAERRDRLLPHRSMSAFLVSLPPDRSALSRRIYSSFPSGLSREKRRIALVVDCSGSMGGDSIAQAKTVLHEILASVHRWLLAILSRHVNVLTHYG